MLKISFSRSESGAGAAKDHTTFDAIELWMEQVASAELANALDRLAGEHVRPKMRSRYQAWSNAIRCKC